jgi:hypothetical protein
VETLMVIAIVALLSPFVYSQISDTSHTIRDMATAGKIIRLREPALNFARLNQDKWPDIAQIQLDSDELADIAGIATAAFIDKYRVQGAVVTDIYLAFDIGGDAFRASQIAKHIGPDAASVTSDGVAYGASWAVSAPDFKPGDLIYRISRDFSGEDNSKYLHRGTSGQDDLNVMLRNLNMGNFDIYGIGRASGDSASMTESSAAFAEAKDLATATAYFAGGANIDGSVAMLGAMRVNGDIMGFRNITARKLNKEGFSTTGTVIADRAKVNHSVFVGRNLNIKSDTSRTVGGFAAIVAHSLATPFVSADEMSFANNFGLTVSGELLMSTTAPLRIGSWIFPSNALPRFSALELSRAKTPRAPDVAEFDKIIKKGWKTI